jgi:GST-like protein
MIDLYTWKTPNGRKVSVMLEECGLRYNAHAVDIGKGEQFTPQFLALTRTEKFPPSRFRRSGRKTHRAV